MKTKTKEEIVEFCENLWGDKSTDEWEKVPETINPEFLNDGIRLEISSQYDAPGLSFKMLSKLAEFFGTMNIDNVDDIRRQGCETCDYGSSYGFVLYIKPE